MSYPTQEGTFALGDFRLQSGEVLHDAKIVWKSYGTFTGANAIVYPTSYSAQHPDIEWLIGPDGILDPTRWFVVIPNMFGNGLSSSPADQPDYPSLVTAYDNVTAQRRLMREVFGVEKIACVYGWSMGAQQAYHWAAAFPDAVERIVINCGSARTAPHNRVFLSGIRAILEAAPEHVGNGRFSAEPYAALGAFGRVYAGWALSQDFYRGGLHVSALGAKDLEDYLTNTWEPRFRRRRAANLHAQIKTWEAGDIGAHELYGGSLPAALRAIKARVLLMPGQTDLYFRVADNEAELPYLARAELKPIPSIWGHLAGNNMANPIDAGFIREAVRSLLAS